MKKLLETETFVTATAVSVNATGDPLNGNPFESTAFAVSLDTPSAAPNVRVTDAIPAALVAGVVVDYDSTTNSLVVAGYGNNPMNLGRKTYYTDFAPRLGLSYLLCTVIENTVGFPMRITIGYVALAILTSGGVGMISGIYPAYKASKLSPIVALARE